MLPLSASQLQNRGRTDSLQLRCLRQVHQVLRPISLRNQCRLRQFIRGSRCRSGGGCGSSGARHFLDTDGWLSVRVHGGRVESTIFEVAGFPESHSAGTFVAQLLWHRCLRTTTTPVAFSCCYLRVCDVDSSSLSSFHHVSVTPYVSRLLLIGRRRTNTLRFHHPVQGDSSRYLVSW